MNDLKCYAIGYARTKKLAKADSAKKITNLIAHIPDV
jgi:hypothetical protein